MPWIDIVVIVLLAGGISWYVVHRILKAKKGAVHSASCSDKACSSCAGCHKEQ